MKVSVRSEMKGPAGSRSLPAVTREKNRARNENTADGEDGSWRERGSIDIKQTCCCLIFSLCLVFFIPRVNIHEMSPKHHNYLTC